MIEKSKKIPLRAILTYSCVSEMSEIEIKRSKNVLLKFDQFEEKI